MHSAQSAGAQEEEEERKDTSRTPQKEPCTGGLLQPGLAGFCSATGCTASPETGATALRAPFALHVTPASIPHLLPKGDGSKCSTSEVP